MLSLIFSLLVSSASGHGFFVDHRGGSGGIAARLFGGIVSKVITLDISSDDRDADAESADNDDEVDSDATPPAAPTAPMAPIPPLPPLPPIPPAGIHFNFDSSGRALPRFTEKAKAVSTVDLLHRIAQTAGWSMTVVGSPKETVDIDVKEVDPREALRQVLKQSGTMGVLKNDKLVVVATGDSHTAGMLVEKSGTRKTVIVQGPGLPQTQSRNRGKRSNDLVHVFQGDLTVPEGRVVQGDVVCVGGSVELSPGSVVQGDAVAVGGSVTVDEGALVMGQAVAVLGTVDVARGAQVMGEHVQVGVSKLFRSRTRHRGWLTSLGPFGLFPTVALFALVYLIGLLVLRLWPDRVRNVGFALFENPVRSFTVGFLCWLLLLPLVVLLGISIVGIPLIPLLPVIIFLSIVIGLSSLAMRIGEALPAGQGQRFVPPAALGMGMAVLLLVAFVPWLGVSLLALLQFFALGASVGSRFGRALPPHAP